MTDFDAQLSDARKRVFEELKTKSDLKVPAAVWDYLDDLERCLWHHYKPPSSWKPTPATNYGGLDQWRKHRSDNFLPFHGWGLEPKP